MLAAILQAVSDAAGAMRDPALIVAAAVLGVERGFALASRVRERKNGGAGHADRRCALSGDEGAVWRHKVLAALDNLALAQSQGTDRIVAEFRDGNARVLDALER